MSSAQLKLVETGGCGGFWVKIGVFSTFWCFSTKSAVAERVSKAVMIVVGGGDSIEGCDSKTTRKSAHFSCPVVAEGSDELTVLVGVRTFGGRETTSLGVGGLV